MDALHDLLDNEKGLVGMLLIIGATVLVALGKMTTDQWQTFATWIFGLYAGSTALHSGLADLGATRAAINGKPAAPAATPETK
jgi:hypothetical protein